MQKMTIHWILIFASLFLILNHSVRAGEECPVVEDNTAYGFIPTVVRGNTAFALDLYARLSKEGNGNLFFSPYSISTALAMTYAGAAGETGEQMSQVLHFPENQAQAKLHPAFSHLQDQVNEVNQEGKIELRTANALWVQRGYPFKANFKGLVGNYYKAPLNQADFATEAEETRQDINLWVETITHDKIIELLGAGSLDSLSRLVLVNAIYFKGNWASQFESDDTHDAPFWVNQKQPVTVPMMNQEHSFKYMANYDIQILELPYAHTASDANSISMIIILPKQRGGLPELERSLSAWQLKDWLSRLRLRNIKVFLPKFKTSTSFELSGTLKKMGMLAAFNENADFSCIDGTRNLSITSVVHQAFVDVNEEGSEAAAATGVVFGVRSMAFAPPTFRADHPFIFLIRHNLSGSILFMGRIVDPSES